MCELMTWQAMSGWPRAASALLAAIELKKRGLMCDSMTWREMSGRPCRGVRLALRRAFRRALLQLAHVRPRLRLGGV